MDPNQTGDPGADNVSATPGVVPNQPTVMPNPAMSSQQPIQPMPVASEPPQPVVNTAPVTDMGDTPQQMQPTQPLPQLNSTPPESKNIKTIFIFSLILAPLNIGVIFYYMFDDRYILDLKFAIPFLIIMVGILAMGVYLKIAKTLSARKKTLYIYGVCLGGVAILAIVLKANAGFLWFFLLYSYIRALMEINSQE